MSWRETVQQYAGRLNRLHPDKHDVRIYDYLDTDVPVLARIYDKRCKGYRALGYVIWPAESRDSWANVSPAPSVKGASSS